MPKYFLWYAVIVVAAGVGVIALGAPITTVLIALAVLACPAMMFFMMGSHRSSGEADHSSNRSDRHNS